MNACSTAWLMIDAWCMLLAVLYVHAFYSGASQVGDGSLSLVERLSSLGGAMGRGLQLVQRIYCSHCFRLSSLGGTMGRGLQLVQRIYCSLALF